LYFKQFVEVKVDARLPSEVRLPVVVPARSGRHLCVELQGPTDVKLGSADRECSLVVELNRQHVSRRFTAQGNVVIESLLQELETEATEQKAAVAVALPVRLA
jgi:hypothetical protein